MRKSAKPVSLHGLSAETVLNYPRAQPMETPGLQKARRVLELAAHDQLGKESSAMPEESSTPAVDAFFEKLAQEHPSEAQKRYPELLKVATPTPKTAAPKRKVPATDAGSASAAPAVQSSLSGGSA